MRPLFIFAICIAFFTSTSIAQVKREASSSQTVQSNATQKNNRKEMRRELNLTKEQRGKIKEFHQSMKQKKEAISTDQTLTEAQKKEKLKELHREQKEQMNTILTPEQKEKMKEEKQNMRMQSDSSK